MLIQLQLIDYLTTFFSNGNPQKAIELLEYAATNEVKDAQKDLVLVYTNGQYIEPNDEKALFMIIYIKMEKKILQKKNLW